MLVHVHYTHVKPQYLYIVDWYICQHQGNIVGLYCSKSTVQNLQTGLLTNGRERQNSWKYRPTALCLGLGLDTVSWSQHC